VTGRTRREQGGKKRRRRMKVRGRMEVMMMMRRRTRKRRKRGRRRRNMAKTPEGSNEGTEQPRRVKQVKKVGGQWHPSRLSLSNRLFQPGIQGSGR
jgi:hypothetical protein